MTRKHARALVALAGVAALVAGCSAGSTPLLPTVPPSTSSSAPPTTAPTTRTDCDANSHESRVKSYAPGSALPAGDRPGQTLAKIKKFGRLRVGVSADNLLFGYRNPIKKQLEGFDIDIVNKIAETIFGPDFKNHIEYRVENFAQRIPDLRNGKVDLVADIMTINCDRWNQIAFTSEYFQAGQQVLVRDNAPYQDIDDLNKAKATVCTADGSTGSENLKKFKQIKPKLVADISDCMVLFQQGTVEGVISDNTVVAGFAAQDPYARIAKRLITDEPYGLGVPAQNVDFVQYLNGLLQTWRTDGTWQAIHDRWLPGQKADPPPAVYGRALP